MKNCKLIPVPKKYEGNGVVKKFIPSIQCEVNEWKPLVKTFVESAQKIYGITFTEGPNGIRIISDATIERESYVVDTRDEMKILASDFQGCAYALATMLQLMNKKVEVEAARIEDRPDKDYRGLMIDLARYWHPFVTLLHYVDLCFFYKVKYLHLHFVDDQSYTLPSKQFPDLPTKGRCYSEDEIKTLCDYAESRGIILLPEIEMPGHSKALVQAYPDVFANRFDEGAKEHIVSESGVVINGESVICAGSEKAFLHATKLIDEVLELFPNSPYIHLGGDEVNAAAWKECPVCREYMRKNHIVDTQELYCDFIARATDYVLSKGRRPIVWEGFPKKYSDKISKKVIVMEFESQYQTPDEVLDNGFEIINCSWKPLYIVPGIIPHNSLLPGKPMWDELSILNWNIYEWQSCWESSAATLNPFHLMPTDQIIGAQLCAWEMSYECEIASVVIRLAALSERMWSVRRHCSDEEFCRKLNVQMRSAFKLII